jgi:hypothetical protein
MDSSDSMIEMMTVVDIYWKEEQLNSLKVWSRYFRHDPISETSACSADRWCLVQMKSSPLYIGFCTLLQRYSCRSSSEAQPRPSASPVSPLILRIDPRVIQDDTSSGCSVPPSHSESRNSSDLLAAWPDTRRRVDVLDPSLCSSMLNFGHIRLASIKGADTLSV